MVSVAFAKPVQPRVQWCHAGTPAPVMRAEAHGNTDAHAPCAEDRSFEFRGPSAARPRTPRWPRRTRPGVLAQFQTRTGGAVPGHGSGGPRGKFQAIDVAMGLMRCSWKGVLPLPARPEQLM